MIQLDQWVLQTMVQLMQLVVVTDHIPILVTLFVEMYCMLVLMFQSYFLMIDDKNDLKLYCIILSYQYVRIICCVMTQGEPWKIVIPETLHHSFISWYHQIFSHIGMTRLYNTISGHFYHQSLKNKIDRKSVV